MLLQLKLLLQRKPLKLNNLYQLYNEATVLTVAFIISCFLLSFFFFR